MGNESLRTNDSVDEILDTYGRMVYRLAYARTKNRYDADDVMQEVFLRYIRSGKEFADEEHRRAWLIRATINCSKTLLSSAWFRKTSPLEDTLNYGTGGKKRGLLRGNGFAGKIPHSDPPVLLRGFVRVSDQRLAED